ncbi:MAG: ATPase, T2SS/T4P/T4SS family [Promethearchaeota archaeon]
MRISKEDVISKECPESNSCYENRRFFLNNLIGTDEDGLIYQDPMKAHTELVWEINLNYALSKKKCERCYVKYAKFLEKIKKVLEKTELIQKYLRLDPSLRRAERKTIYGLFLTPKYIPRKRSKVAERFVSKGLVVDQYRVRPFTITICESENNPVELHYLVDSIVGKPKFQGIFLDLIRGLRDVSTSMLFEDEFLDIDMLISLKKQEAMRFLSEKYPEIPDDFAKELALLGCFEVIGLGTIMPFLLDDKIEEFYVDTLNSAVYLDHRKWGRCNTSIYLSEEDRKRLVTHFRAKSGLRLDELSPSLKTEIVSKLFHIRASVDIDPLAADGFHLDIRKLRKRHFTLSELIANSTLTEEVASYLYFCLIRKRNMTILGRPGSGKTTLINAIDMLTPSSWRKITVEDVIESISQTDYGKHQVRFQVKPFEGEDNPDGKVREITKLLHRSPDWVLISEIQTPEDSVAMFRAISTGLTGLQTCHAMSPEDLLIRWNVHHKIPPVCFSELDLLLHVKRFTSVGEPKRRLVRVCEINAFRNTNFSEAPEIELVDVYRWNPALDTVELKTRLFETPTLEKIRQYENISLDDFTREINTYSEIFRAMREKNIFTVDENVQIFNYLYSLRQGLQEHGEINWTFLKKLILEKIEEEES